MRLYPRLRQHRVRFWYAGLAGLVALGWIAAALSSGCIGRWIAAPRGTYAAFVPPVAPDYSMPAAWSARPGWSDLGRQTPAGMTSVRPEDARAAVFYLHPTTSFSHEWNAPIDDAERNEATDRHATLPQATAFNGCCDIWAPRYRQANRAVFVHPSSDGELALALALEDVTRAFGVFLEQIGDRPFWIVGHSQGAVLGRRLLASSVVGTAYEERLVAAVLPGGGLTYTNLADVGLPVCATPDATRCVLGWNARAPAYVPGDGEMAGVSLEDRVCVNPLTFSVAAPSAAPSDFQGAVYLDDDEHIVDIGEVGASCAEGTLTVTPAPTLPASFGSRILEHWLGDGNLHLVDIPLFYVNIRENAVLRTNSWLLTSASAE